MKVPAGSPYAANMCFYEESTTSVSRLMTSRMPYANSSTECSLSWGEVRHSKTEYPTPISVCQICLSAGQARFRALHPLRHLRAGPPRDFAALLPLYRALNPARRFIGPTFRPAEAGSAKLTSAMSVFQPFATFKLLFISFFRFLDTSMVCSALWSGIMIG